MLGTSRRRRAHPLPTTTKETMSAKLDAVLERLSELSRRGYYNPYTRFDWPADVPRDSWWMDPEFLTVHGTDEILDGDVSIRLSQAETINFFSLHVHGIRELMGEVAIRIHTPRYRRASEYLHHFLGEENDHMWFFAEFCNRYWDGVYPAAAPSPLAATTDADAGPWNDFVVFSRILIFEELFDYYNARLGTSTVVPPIVAELHNAHHHDENRHVAFGKRLVEWLYAEALENGGACGKPAVATYIKNYIEHSVASMYNPRCYAYAGVANPLALRRRLLGHPARRQVHSDIMRRLDRFYLRLGLYEGSWVR
ncbi:AurF domain containing protein [Nocardia yunnanensis]|uniref:AurF domain containing protein n=2 Tax=Nocardia yunnanensis TaxID=2382165 RepID=A0A386ZHV2_9NOCA|nr:AurF domain containing protein [Nocardia yunnanensis]